METKFTIRAVVRKRGAIGIFYSVMFTVTTSIQNPSEDFIKSLWFAHYGDQWELHHFARITRDETRTNEATS